MTHASEDRGMISPLYGALDTLVDKGFQLRAGTFGVHTISIEEPLDGSNHPYITRARTRGAITRRTTMEGRP